jgi:hypothetical protein
LSQTFLLTSAIKGYRFTQYSGSLEEFQEALDTDLADVFAPDPVPRLYTQARAPQVAILALGPNYVLSIPSGAWLGHDDGSWRVMPDAVMRGPVFTAATV